MTHHWPIPASAGLIALALALGMWQRERAADAAAPSARRAQAVTAPAAAAKTEETAAVETLAPENPAPQPVQPVTAAPAPKAIPVAPAQPVQPTQPVQPAQPQTAAVQPVQPMQPVPVKPAQPAQPAQTQPAQPAQPATPAGQPAAAPAASPRDKIIADFKTTLQNKLALQPLEMAAGAWAFASDGARLEVQPPPNWTVTIYNANAKQPDVETDAFKKFLQLATGALGLDTSQPVVRHDNGKTYQKTTSKLGSVSIVRDPAAGNSCVIRPIGQQVVVPKPPEAPKPAAPKAPDTQKPAGQDF